MAGYGLPQEKHLAIILKNKLKDSGYNLEVIDVIENLEMVEKDNILATPTLIKSSPPPERRVIGDLSDREKILLSLGFTIESGELRKCKEEIDC